MKKIIRHSSWETNSSSTHSITLGKNIGIVYDMIHPDENGEINFSSYDEFGWEFVKTNETIRKLSYAVLDNVDQDILIEAIKKVTKAKKVTFKVDGYIDHQSNGTAREKCKSVIDTVDFIFNKNSWLYCGNDNTNADPSFYENEVYKHDGTVIPVKYNYEMVIKFKNKEFSRKLIDYPNEDEIKKTITSLISNRWDCSVNDDNEIFDDTNESNYEIDYLLGVIVKDDEFILVKDTYTTGKTFIKTIEYDRFNVKDLYLEYVLNTPEVHKKIKFTINKL